MNNTTAVFIALAGVCYFLIRVAGLGARDLGPLLQVTGVFLGLGLLLVFGFWGLQRFLEILGEVWRALRHD